jgi:1-pyrroline-5-carboxylate dehydrogenase
MSNVPTVLNEPILTYAPGSPERAEIREALDRLRGEQPEIPLVIGGRERTTGDMREQREPQRHARTCATWAAAGPGEAAEAIDAALAARPDWSSWPQRERAAILLRAADLLAGPWRQRVNAATMLGQGKTVREAEIDAAAELADFWRFNCYFAEQLAEAQPISTPGVHNRMEQRDLEGFVYAVTPFNFTAIGGNLPTAPALMGNTVVWKPSKTALLSNWLVFQILREAGLPDGVINFVPGDPEPITKVCLDHPEFAGVHFTGSSAIFRSLFREVGERIDRYRGYPRLVGETGGKDFVVMHASADPQAVAVALVRGSFEYQGQKCSAASRAYIPDTLWPEVRDRALALVGEIRQGDPTDLATFMGAVIDGRAFARLREAFALVESSSSARILCGGGTDDSVGWFVEPTIVETSDPHFDTMERELFGPCLTVHPYPEARYAETLELCNSSSPYALTGSIFARDRAAIALAHATLRHAAGNFYVNDKPTGSVVGQQPFGGGRASGTNDKAGWSNNLMRWSSPRAVKETSVSPLSLGYPHMEPDGSA